MSRMLMDYATVVRNCGPVPPAIYDAVKRYVEEGREPGGFVLACLQNDLQMAVTRADPCNRERLQEIVWMLNSAIPSVSFGSPQKVRAWLDGGWQHARRFKDVYDEPHSQIERAD